MTAPEPRQTTVPEIPDAAVQAAAEAMLDARDCEHLRADPYLECCFPCDARTALEAAAPLIAAQERRKVSEQISDLAAWEFAGGFVNLFAFIERHERLKGAEVTILSAALRALAGEIEGADRAE